MSAVHAARALAYLARQDAGPPPQDPEDRESWREEVRAGYDAYRAGRAVAVGADRLDALVRAVNAGRYDIGDCGSAAEALENVEHGCMSRWPVTPYGTVWVDSEA
ncbi:hypothetical protein [Streptomyces olivaceus]|uniref:hypothetical protein n=1 Tax=Streptomyces olivaceus TaxID=47716 RepID=UPI0022EF5EBD|nr:hypothetical protein [Streptomyces olivaceus]GHI98107.1 hypothetical protein TPA0905_75780 [Streptomyces olivaceus]